MGGGAGVRLPCNGGTVAVPLFIRGDTAYNPGDVNGEAGAGDTGETTDNGSGGGSRRVDTGGVSTAGDEGAVEDTSESRLVDTLRDSFRPWRKEQEEIVKKNDYDLLLASIVPIRQHRGCGPGWSAPPGAP